MNNQQTTSPLKIGLDVIQYHPLCRSHFGQYQASSAVMGWHVLASHPISFLWCLKSIHQITHPLYTFFVYAATYSIIIAIIICAELASVARHQVLFYSSIMTASYHSICYFTHTVAITLLAHMPHSLSVQSCGSVQLVHTPHSLPVEFCGSVPPPCPLDAVLVCLVLA